MRSWKSGQRACWQPRVDQIGKYGNGTDSFRAEKQTREKRRPLPARSGQLAVVLDALQAKRPLAW